MMENDVRPINTEHASVASCQELKKLQTHQRAWEVFGIDVVNMIPVLQAQMSAVTKETERAASELMIHMRVLSAASSEGTSHDRTESLAKIVMAMQFQDITRQKLEHVGKALSQMSSHLNVLLKGPDDAGAEQQLVAMEQFGKHYTMEAERRLHQETLAPEYGEPVPTNLSKEGDDSVTIF